MARYYPASLSSCDSRLTVASLTISHLFCFSVNCLKRAFGSGTHLLALARAKSYRVHVTKMTGGTNAAGSGGGFAGGRTISFWCFAPALAMRELSFLNVRSIIITSGTLSPLPSCAMELGLKFPVQLENEHVIMPDQIFVRVIGKGVSGKELSSKFGRRDDPEYITELGNTLASLCGNIPGGMLVFFPSYVAMEAAIQRWEDPRRRRSSGTAGVNPSAAAEGVRRSSPRRLGRSRPRRSSYSRWFPPNLGRPPRTNRLLGSVSSLGRRLC